MNAERLTKRYENEVVRNTSGVECSNFCTNCGRADCDYIRMALYKLAHYEDLEEQCRLIELPCKPFEKVWVAHEKFGVIKTSFSCYSDILFEMENGYQIAKTKEEAEAKLAELRG